MNNTSRPPILGILLIVSLGLFSFKEIYALRLDSFNRYSKLNNNQVEVITSRPGVLNIGKNSSPSPSSNPSYKPQSSPDVTNSKPQAKPSISPSPSPMFSPSPSVRPAARAIPRSLSIRYIRPMSSIRPQVTPSPSPQASQSAFTRRKRNYKLHNTSDQKYSLLRHIHRFRLISPGAIRD